MLTLDLQDLYGSWDEWNRGQTDAFTPETQTALDAGWLVLGYREDGDRNQAIADAVRAVRRHGEPGAVTFELLELGFGDDAVFVAAYDQSVITITEPKDTLDRGDSDPDAD